MMKQSTFLKFVLKRSYLFIFLAAVLPYLNSFHGEFAFDDIFLVEHDSFYESAPVWDCWKRPYWQKENNDGLYRPIVTLSFWLNTRIVGKYSSAFRTVNIILNAVVCVVLFRLFLALGISVVPAFGATLLFAGHPIHSEAVIPASGRADILCALFVFAGMLFHIKATKERRNLKDIIQVKRKWHFFRYYNIKELATALCIFLALLSKENGIILFPLCLIYDLFYHKNFFRQRTLYFKYFLYLFAVIFALLPRIAITGSIFPKLGAILIKSDNILALCPYPIRLATALKLQGYALWKFLCPVVLSHDYSYAQILPVSSLLDKGFLLTIFLIFFACAALLRAFSKQKRLIALLLISYAVSVFPTSNIVFCTGTIFGERLFYLPSAWLCVLTLLIFRKYACCKIGHKPSILLFCIILFLFGTRTWHRGEDWSSQLALATKGVETSPNSSKTWNNLAVQLFNHGNYEEAILACKKALEIMPEDKKPLKILAYSQINLKNFNEAKFAFRELINAKTKDTEVYNKLGAILANEGQEDEAKLLWQKSLEINPNQGLIRKYLEEMH